jgi:hypothetical protein
MKIDYIFIGPMKIDPLARILLEGFKKGRAMKGNIVRSLTHTH